MPVVIDKNIAEYDGLDLRHGKLSSVNPIELFFLEGGKETLHPGVVIAFASAAHALDGAISGERSAESSAGELAPPIGVENH